MRTYEFSLFALGADLTVASTVEQLERAGYTHPVAPANDGIQALAFSRQAKRLIDAVDAVVSETEQIQGVSVARDLRSDAVGVFHPVTMTRLDVTADLVPTTTRAATPATKIHAASQAPHVMHPVR